jgi:hypothetical protein
MSNREQDERSEAAPVPAILTDERIESLFHALDGMKLIAGENQLNWNKVVRLAFARAIEAELAASKGQAVTDNEALAMLARVLKYIDPSAVDADLARKGPIADAYINTIARKCAERCLGRAVAPVAAVPGKGRAVHQWRQRAVGSYEPAWYDATKDDAYARVDEHYEVRTLYTHPSPVSALVAVDRNAAARDVLAERQRQISVEGWTTEHDDQYQDDELSCAAACYAMSSGSGDCKPMNFWPWNYSWWKPAGERGNLVKAGALILAEIERIDRATPLQQSADKPAEAS